MLNPHGNGKYNKRWLNVICGLMKLIYPRISHFSSVNYISFLSCLFYIWACSVGAAPTLHGVTQPRSELRLCCVRVVRHSWARQGPGCCWAGHGAAADVVLTSKQRCSLRAGLHCTLHCCTDTQHFIHCCCLLLLLLPATSIGCITSRGVLQYFSTSPPCTWHCETGKPRRWTWRRWWNCASVSAVIYSI